LIFITKRIHSTYVFAPCLAFGDIAVLEFKFKDNAMKSMIRLLVVGVLTTSASMPFVNASPMCLQVAHGQVATTGWPIYRILEAAESGLEAVLGRNLTVDALYMAYEDGLLQIAYEGQSADGEVYAVAYDGGDIFVVLLDE
jgi:hypothetical protein